MLMIAMQIYIPFRNAEANGGASAQLRSEMLIGAKQRFARYNPHFGKFGGFPTGSSSLPYPKCVVPYIDISMLLLWLACAGIAM